MISTAMSQEVAMPIHMDFEGNSGIDGPTTGLGTFVVQGSKDTSNRLYVGNLSYDHTEYDADGTYLITRLDHSASAIADGSSHTLMLTENVLPSSNDGSLLV
jgi:hypothetical protein